MNHHKRRLKHNDGSTECKRSAHMIPHNVFNAHAYRFPLLYSYSNDVGSLLKISLIRNSHSWKKIFSNPTIQSHPTIVIADETTRRSYSQAIQTSAAFILLAGAFTASSLNQRGSLTASSFNQTGSLKL